MAVFPRKHHQNRRECHLERLKSQQKGFGLKNFDGSQSIIPCIICSGVCFNLLLYFISGNFKYSIAKGIKILFLCARR